MLYSTLCFIRDYVFVVIGKEPVSTKSRYILAAFLFYWYSSCSDYRLDKHLTIDSIY